MKKPINTLKQWISIALTCVVVVALFGIIFVSFDLAQPSPEFFAELGVILSLTLLMRTWWYSYAEDKRLSEPDIADAKKRYFDIVDATIKDSNDLDEFLVVLNEENKEHYVHNKIGCRTVKSLSKKTKLMCFLHPSYKKLTPEEIGNKRFNKLIYHYKRKADKLPTIKSEEIMALSDSYVLYDAKNHTKQHKKMYQLSSTVISFVLTTAFAVIAFKEINMSWESAFRYITYIANILYGIAQGLFKGYKHTGEDTLDHLERLKFIVDKYATYKGGRNGNIISGDSLADSPSVQRA